MNTSLHTQTPALVVTDPRDLAVRDIAFYRSRPDQPVAERLTHQAHDPAGRLIDKRDPRLAHPNLSTTYSLSGRVLLTDSVDAGWQLALWGEAGQALASWNSRDIQRRIEYDTLLRPETVTEQGRVTERAGYGGPNDHEHNQCNRLIRHDDPAGTRHLSDYGVPGSPMRETRYFLPTAGTPDWPLAETERDALLENVPFTTSSAFNALGEVMRQTDAMGHAQHFSQTVAGQLKVVELTLAGAEQAQTLVSEIRYNAFDRVEQETAENGVVSRSYFDPQDGRLMEFSAALPGQPALQHLIYSYDPVGNILLIEDRAQPVRFFANQRIEPVNQYTYDTLYQLIEATGREVNTGASHGPALPGLQPLPPDPNQVSNYTRQYDYDAAGNLLQMRHVGAQAFTRTIRVAPDSNRSLPEGETDADFETGFDASGNLLQLVRGQTLEWDLRNQLQQITTVTRATAVSDHERYVYDARGQRCRKINSSQTSSRALTNEVRYLPGLEIRTSADGEVLHVITADKVRVLHWQAGKPDGIANDQIRYSLTDHLGSSTLELDRQGGLISQESYYPFGGTAWWAARSALEAKYKTIRYSGKERDASGLYYYGFRYYAPWLQRWINPDPAGDVDGLNLFRFVGNNPVVSVDDNGTITVFTNRDEKYFIDEGLQARLDEIQQQSSVQYDFLKTAYTHEFENRFTISSRLYHPEHVYEDNFQNEFRPHMWTFIENYKHITKEPVVHADQVATEQFRRVSTAEGFPNTLPSVIKRSLVINKGVQEVARQYASGSTELMNAFLTRTQNGKSTNRLLKTFRLIATRVETKLSGSSDLDVYVHVEPEALAAARQEVEPLKTPSRFTVTAVEPPAPASRFSVTPVSSRFTVSPATIDLPKPSPGKRRLGGHPRANP